jgi:hypothetical protein
MSKLVHIRFSSFLNVLSGSALPSVLTLLESSHCEHCRTKRAVTVNDESASGYETPAWKLSASTGDIGNGREKTTAQENIGP